MRHRLPDAILYSTNRNIANISAFFLKMENNKQIHATGSFVTGEETLHSGNFLELHLIKYTDQDGAKRRWESAVRKNSTPAVMILPIISLQDHHPLITGKGLLDVIHAGL